MSFLRNAIVTHMESEAKALPASESTIEQILEMQTEALELRAAHREAVSTLASLEHIQASAAGASAELLVLAANTALENIPELQIAAPSMESAEDCTEVAMEGIADAAKQIAKAIKSMVAKISKTGKKLFRSFKDMFRTDYGKARSMVQAIDEGALFKDVEIKTPKGAVKYLHDGHEQLSPEQALHAVNEFSKRITPEDFNKFFEEASRAVVFGKDAAPSIGKASDVLLTMFGAVEDPTMRAKQRRFFVTTNVLPAKWTATITAMPLVDGDRALYIPTDFSASVTKSGGPKSYPALDESRARGILTTVMDNSTHGDGLISTISEQFWETIDVLDKLESATTRTQVNAEGETVTVTTAENGEQYYRLLDMFVTLMDMLYYWFKYQGDVQTSMVEMVKASME